MARIRPSPFNLTEYPLVSPGYSPLISWTRFQSSFENVYMRAAPEFGPFALLPKTPIAKTKFGDSSSETE